MAKYRLLALDLDETLLNKHKQISEKSKLWIYRAMIAGVTVIFATGRGIQRVEKFRKELKLISPMVVVNGAEVWSATGRLIERQFICKEKIPIIYNLANKFNADYWAYNTEGLVKEHPWNDQLLNMNWMKFSIRHNDSEIITHIRKTLIDIPELEVASSAPNNIEVSPEGISKETGVKKVCEHLDIDIGDVMAIGDNINDLRLIKSAGLGIAMGNAEDQVRNAADEVTNTNEEDGVAHAIQKFLF